MKLEPYDSHLGTTFRFIIKGINQFTPKILGYIRTASGIVEVSEGTGLDKRPIYGVTVVANNEHNYELSKCLFSYQEVKEYIKYLNYEDHTSLIKLLKQL